MLFLRYCSTFLCMYHLYNQTLHYHFHLELSLVVVEERHRSIADRRHHMLKIVVHERRLCAICHLCKIWPNLVATRPKLNLIGVCETKFFDTTNGLATVRFLVLVAKPLVLSKNFVSQTPFRIEFWSEVALSQKSQN